MKRIIIAVLCAVIAVIFSLGVYLYIQSTHLVVDKVLPHGALVYARFDDIQGNLKKFNATPLGKSIRDIDYDLLVEEGGLTAVQKSIIQGVTQSVDDPAVRTLLTEFFSREFALAVYPFSIDPKELLNIKTQNNFSIVEKILQDAVLITRISSKVQLGELVLRFFKQKKGVLRETIHYKGETIYMVIMPNYKLRFGFVRLKDLLVVGVGDKAAKASIDVFKKETKNLSEDLYFLKAQTKRDSSPSIRGYWNMKGSFDMVQEKIQVMKSVIQQNMTVQPGRFENILKTMSGLEVASFSADWDNISRLKLKFFFNKEELSPELKFVYSCPAQKNTTLRFVPQEVLFYQWSNCLDIKYYWNQFTKSATGEQNSTQQQIGALLGVGVEKEILPALGDEIGGYLEDVEMGGAFPVPRFGFFLEIEDQEKIELLLKELLDYPLIDVRSEDYEGMALKYIVTPLGKMLEPGYCFIDKFLLIASDQELLRHSIDAYKKKDHGLLTHKDFQAVDFGLTDRNRSVQFIRIGTVIGKVREFLEGKYDRQETKDLKTNAFRAGQQKRLEDMEKDISEQINALNYLREQLNILEKQMRNQKSQASDNQKVEMRNQQIQLKREMASKRTAMQQDREHKEELEKMIQDSGYQRIEAQTQRVYLDEVIYPILAGMGSLKTMGIRATLEEDFFKMMIFLDGAN